MAANNVQQDPPSPNGYGGQEPEFMKNIPTWARAWVALLTVGVTVLLALNLNIGGFWDKQLDAAITRQNAQNELGKGSLDGLVEISKGLLQQNSQLLEAVNKVMEQNREILRQAQSQPITKE